MTDRQKILVVDDNRRFCELLSEALEDGGYEVRFVTEAEAAYEIADDFQPDLSILDINMPGVDGLDLMALLKGYTSVRTKPILFISALPAEKMEQQCKELGAVGYIEKPPSFSQVLETVKRHLTH